MRIESTIDYYSEEVLTFDPEKILNKLTKFFSDVEIDPIDYSFRQVERIVKLATAEIEDATQRSRIINQIKGKNRANGPSFKFKVTTGDKTQIDGYVQRYSIGFKSEEEISLETEIEIIKFLKSLNYGEIRSTRKTENFSQPHKEISDYWVLDETAQ